MEFLSTDKVRQRLEQMERLTREQIQEIASHVQFLRGENEVRLVHRYFAELLVLLGGDLLSVQGALNENRDAIQHFDESSRRLNRWLVGLTVALVFLTVVIAIFTTVLVFKK